MNNKAEEIKGKVRASGEFMPIGEEKIIGNHVTICFAPVNKAKRSIAEIAEEVRKLFPEETGIISSDFAVTMECNENRGQGVSPRSIHVHFLFVGD